MTIGERIKQRRLELKLSVDEVATRLGKNRATIYRYENSDIENLPTTVLEPLAKILETTPAYLMGWKKEIDATISKELQISQEALYTIDKFSRTIDKFTGHSMMDLFNAMVIHKNFEKIIKEMLLYISRRNEDWEKMVEFFRDEKTLKSTNVDTIKALCCASMTKNFEELITDVLNSNIDTFNDVRKDENGNLIISAKPQNKYFVFDDIDSFSKGKKGKAGPKEKTMTEVPKYVKEDTNYVNAAHAINGASEEDKQFDENIMDDENF